MELSLNDSTIFLWGISKDSERIFFLKERRIQRMSYEFFEREIWYSMYLNSFFYGSESQSQISDQRISFYGYFFLFFFLILIAPCCIPASMDQPRRKRDDVQDQNSFNASERTRSKKSIFQIALHVKFVLYIIFIVLLYYILLLYYII